MQEDLFEKYIAAADVAVIFSGIGGDADEFMRFLQLEWESYADAPKNDERSRRFYKNLRDYKKYQVKKDWRTDFSARDFNDLLV